MTNYVLVYTGGTMPETEAEQATVMADWGTWYEKLGADIVDGGNPFNASKMVDADGVNDNAPMLTGYTVISADTLDDALGKVANHPHIKHGGQVSVYQTFRM